MSLPVIADHTDRFLLRNEEPMYYLLAGLGAFYAGMIAAQEQEGNDEWATTNEREETQ